MRLVILGFGVVGRALARLIVDDAPRLARRCGVKPILVGVADSAGAVYDHRGLDPLEILRVKEETGTVAGHTRGVKGMKGTELLDAVYPDVLVEVSPTNLTDGEPGLTHIREALKAGVNVVTTNKGPLALEMPALMELARYNRVSLRFSGTVGGGTPILDYGRLCLNGDRIESFEGILNGTTNYILTRMTEELSFKEALQEAQEKGYAERDPSMDIDGLDAACKLVILANYLLGLRVTLRDIEVRGIRGISREYVAEAYKKGYAVKLLASAEAGRLEVGPVEIPLRSPLCVWGNLNALTFKCERLGEQTVIGRGAGGVETAISVLRDLIEIKRSLSRFE